MSMKWMPEAAKASLFVMLALGAGCAPLKPLPTYMQSAASTDHPKFPRAKFIVEVSKSTLSPEDADLKAKKQVSGRISEQLTAETKSYMELRQKNGLSQEQQSLTESIVVKTDFSRSELIAIVERERRGDEYYSVAVLDRARADDELGKERHADLVEYKSYAETALNAYEAKNLSEFWSASMRAGGVRPVIDATWIKRRAVMGRPSDDEARFVALADQLVQKVAVAMSKQLVILRIDGDAEPDLLKMANAALQKLKLRVGDVKTCAAVAADAQMYAAELVFQPEETCGEGSLGERCEVGVQLRAASCAGGSEGRGSIPSGKGVHPSDRAKARKAAWGRVLTAPLIESAVKEALKGAVTTTCSNAGC